MALRQSRRLGPARRAGIVNVPASTVHRVLVRHGVNRLRWMDRPTGRVIRRFERARPGELVHIDVKKLGRIPDGGGHKVLGREARTGSIVKRGGGYTHVHTAIDAYSRLAYSEFAGVENATNCAANGMLTALDPHSAYLNPKNFRDMQVQTRGEFGGLGIEVTMENGIVKVVSPIDDTPASKAGLQTNDLITHLDGDQIVGLTLEQAVEKMRGPVNTPITLTVVRKGRDDPFDIKIVRDVIRINAIKVRQEGDIIYVKVSTFNEQTHANLVKKSRPSRRRWARTSRAMSSTCAATRAVCSTRRSRCRTISSRRARSS